MGRGHTDDDAMTATPCCDDMRDALEHKWVERNPLDEGEIQLPRRQLLDVYPEAKVGNVLTDEPATQEAAKGYAMSLALRWCPWCRAPLAEEEQYAELDDE